MTPEQAALLVGAVAKQADKQAFAELFSYFAPRIKGYLMGLKASPGEAEELAQEAMLIVWRKAAQFDPAKAAVSTWIFTISRNRFVDLKRKQARPLPDRYDPLSLPPDAPDPEQQAAGTQHQQAVRQALSTLPDAQAEIVKMAFLRGLSHMEIAEETNLPLGTVKSRIRLAFARLGPLLEHLQ
jgi:RNA polymerase sigma-70 factor (ECF subfamily)